ncbi:hypothetical protein HA402_004207 [Bradysia odoriphaga]|nr:hypothetical protein HA402_004207 [Bradysia odoriphaga]
MAEAIIGIYQGNSWSRQHSRRSRFNIHWIMQAVGSTLSISGVLVQWFAYGKHHMNNYHAFLGIISIFFMMGAFLNGTIALWAPEIRKWIKPVYSRWFHNVIGIIAFAIGMASISHGYDLRDFSRRSTVPIMYALKWAAYVTAVLSLIGAVKSLYEQTKGVIAGSHGKQSLLHPIAQEKFRKPKKDSTKEKLPIVAVPYVKGLFEKLRTVCKDDFMLVGKGENTLKRTIFSKLKDPTPKMHQSFLVYCIPCSCGYKYTGQTLQLLKDRVYQHKHNISIKNNSHSALCDHAISTGHTPLWDEVKIVYRETNQKKRDILEMIAVKKTPNSLNKQTDCVMLSTVYNNVI